MIYIINTSDIEIFIKYLNQKKLSNIPDYCNMKKLNTFGNLTYFYTNNEKVISFCSNYNCVNICNTNFFDCIGNKNEKIIHWKNRENKLNRILNL